MILIKKGISLVRNLSDFEFLNILSNEDKKDLLDNVDDALTKLQYITLPTQDPIRKKMLYETGDVGADFLEENFARFYKSGSYPDILVNQTEHIEILKFSKTQDFFELYEPIKNIEEKLAKDFKFSFNIKFGYLTSRPLNCGTGLYPWAELHLPALRILGIDDIKKSFKRLGYNLVSETGKRSQAVGSKYYLTFESTFSESENSYLEKMENILVEIVKLEEDARKKLYMDNLIYLKDIVKRAYGTLRHARILPEEEMIDSMSYLELGKDMSIIKTETEIDFLARSIRLRDGHIQFQRGASMDLRSRDILRANNARALMREVF